MGGRVRRRGHMDPPKVIFYWSSTPSNLKCRTEIDRIRTLLQAKQVSAEEVDLAETPERREEMLAGSEGAKHIPQLHVNGKSVAANFDILQELEDAGELDALLTGN